MPSSAALSTAPCQGSSGPLVLCSCLLHLHFLGTTGALALSDSPAHCKLGARVSSALHFAPFSQGFLLLVSSLGSLSSLLGRAPGLLSHWRLAAIFPLFQRTIQVWVRHKRTFHSSLANKHSGAHFGRQKVCLSLIHDLL